LIHNTYVFYSFICCKDNEKLGFHYNRIIVFSKKSVKRFTTPIRIHAPSDIHPKTSVSICIVVNCLIDSVLQMETDETDVLQTFLSSV